MSQLPNADNPLVVQHNALVNAQFGLNTTETRLFLAMLAHLQMQDTAFPECQLIVRDIVDHASNNYNHVRKMLDDFASRKLRIEELSADGSRPRQRTYTVAPLIAYIRYQEGEGQLAARFNDALLPYLLELRGNFTKAQLHELLKLKSAHSFRIYWLLREYASFGKRTIAVGELKAILGVAQEYERFNNFRLKVLDKAQQELAKTDLPFTYNLIKQGRQVTQIEFCLTTKIKLVEAAPIADWEKALLAVGVSAISLRQIHGRLAAGDYDIGYVRYVLATIKSQVQAGKVKREAGAVFKALADGYLLPDYHRDRLLPHKRKLSPAAANRHKKLCDELDDACNSLRFIKASNIYTDETRPVAQQQVESRITQIRSELMAIAEYA